MKCLLVDGFNLAFRAFHAMPALTRTDGFPVGAIHAWVRILWKLKEQEAPCRITVFFDKEGSQRHLALHADYKATRSETPKPLVAQIPELKAITAHMGFRVVEQAGVEADDLIASAARALAADGHTVRIASADKDFAQCVNAQVHLLVPTAAGQGKAAGWLPLDAAGVREKFGVPPERIVDYLSLIGDTVDNIPGLSGVGPKTAASWIETYGDIDGILAARESITPERFRVLLREADALLRLNRQLIAFRTDFTGEWDADGQEDEAAMRVFFERMEMHSSLKELARRNQPQPEKQTQLELLF